MGAFTPSFLFLLYHKIWKKSNFGSGAERSGEGKEEESKKEKLGYVGEGGGVAV